jgi:hypothetical protein
MSGGEYWTGIGYYSLGNGVGVYICARWHEQWAFSLDYCIVYLSIEVMGPEKQCIIE